MERRRLLQYIQTLSEEDRKTFKPLIDDALRRDKALAEVVFEARKHAEMLETHTQCLQETTERFHESVSRLNGKLAGIAEVSRNALLGIPFGNGGRGGHSTLRH
ncbi:MAG: hypothetical protein IH577_04835 [Deltaproteobacteria bacterium]|nr:hypothetical protein [Deltaproteobacteria bacterium]